MDYNSILYFIKAYKARSLSQAAKDLFISQQGLSKSIRALETELGVPLFYRSKKGVVPTKYADAVYPHFLSILESYNRILEDVEEASKRRVGTINLGIINGVFTAIPLGKIINSFNNLYPDIRINASIEYDYVCEDLLCDEKIDIAFMAEPVENENITHQTVFEDCLYICVNKDHPLAVKDEVQICDFDGEKMLNVDSRFKMFHTMDKVFHKAGVNPRYVFAPTEIQDFWQLAADLDAISVFPENWFRKIIPSGDFHFAKIAEPELRLKFCIGYKNSKIRTPNEKLFYKYVLDYLKYH